jgi:hypothetical protein
MVWNSIPEDVYGWKPDENALNCLEMVRHVLEAEYLYLCIPLSYRVPHA